MPEGVLLDTSFLISFADPSRPHHAAAVQYFKHCAREGIPMYLSTIAAAEFAQKQSVHDLPLEHFLVLPFNLEDAEAAAALDFKRFRLQSEVARDALKDDFKLLGQVKVQRIAHVLTEDSRSLFRFCADLRDRGELQARPLKLEDGFAQAAFDPNPQTDFLSDLESPGTP